MKLLIVEDEPKMASALQRGLLERGFEAEIVTAGFEAEEKAAASEYDVILLDRVLPDRDGLDVCRNLRRLGVRSKVLMVTALSGTAEKIDGLDAGADDYMTKPFEFDELVARLRALMRRGEASEARHLRFDGLELDLYSRSARRAGQTIELSNREFSLLEFLMRNPNRALSRTQIGSQVWDINFEPSSNVVDVYVSALRRKIDRSFDRELIQTVKGVGYRLGVPESAGAGK